jgi:hypothetical protein
MAQRTGKRDAAAEPDEADAPRRVVQQQRHVREEPLRQHVAAIRRVHLSVDRECGNAGQAADGHRGSRAFAVIEQTCPCPSSASR